MIEKNTMSGTVEAIYICSNGGAEMLSMASVVLEANAGIVDDRYHRDCGTFSKKLKDNPKREITFIEQEEIDRFNREQACRLGAGQLRRNIITRGIRLNELQGKEFRIGKLRFQGIELCEPCTYLARTVEARVLPHLTGRAGLRARILGGGQLAVGDRFSPQAYEDIEPQS
ncbi:MAG: MOSC domain-containing protein [Pseudohongiellaceae bacterium]